MLRQIIYILAVLASILLIGAAVFYFAEKHVQEESTGKPFTFLDALYWAIVTVTTIGYGDISPQTWVGRVAAVSIAIGGIAAFTALVGLIANTLVEHTTRRILGLEGVKYMNHIVVLGWNPLVHRLLQELRANLHNTRIVLVDENAPLDLGLADVIRGDPLVREVLAKAEVPRASHIIVATGDDSRTVLAVLHSRRLNPRAKIVALAMDEENIDILRQAGADKIVPASIASTLLASYIYEPSVPDLIVDMAATTIGESDVVEKPATIYRGKPFVEALAEAKKRENMVILAIRTSSGELLINPPPDYVIRENDTLIALVTGVKKTS